MCRGTQEHACRLIAGMRSQRDDVRNKNNETNDSRRDAHEKRCPRPEIFYLADLRVMVERDVVAELFDGSVESFYRQHRAYRENDDKKFRRRDLQCIRKKKYHDGRSGLPIKTKSLPPQKYD